MAWRIADYIEHGEIDNRYRDRVTGTLWICGLDAPIRLELTGNAWRDLAGQRLCFRNPSPKPIPEHLSDIALDQTGVVGDITAARKVKVLDFPIEELEKYYKTGIPMPRKAAPKRRPTLRPHAWTCSWIESPRAWSAKATTKTTLSRS